MPETEVAEELIATVMARAEARVWIGNPRCYAFPDPLVEAGHSCTPKGRCRVGWILANSGRESWDVWLEVSAGLVKLIPRANA